MRRPVVIAALAMLVAIGVALPRAGETRAATPEPKVVVIVGATHGTTPKYRQWADVIVAEAKKYTSNVVKVYSPYATWSAVKSALQGANVVVYMGHGNGFPNPYRSVLWPYSVDGFGLNAVAGQGDYNTKYYGEYYVANEVKLAPNAVVILNHLCYASGNPEPGNPEATLSVAHQRIDNYGAGFIKAGAAAVVAEGRSGGEWWIRTLFTTRQTMEQAFRSNPAENGHIVTFPSSRTPGATAFSDPDTTSGGYYRSMVGDRDLETADVTGAPAADTGADPDDFVVPGSASVGAGGATIFGGADLAAESTTLPADAKLRILAAAPDDAAGRVFRVSTLDGDTTGYAAEADLIPRDSRSPMVWGVPDQLLFSPNGDGVGDVLAVRANFSETVDWTVRIRDGDGQLVWSKAGSGADLAADWKGTTGGGGAAPEGVYDLAISGADEWGNSPVARTSQVLLDRHPDDRLAGDDRYATAAAISKATFAPGVELAYVATGANFPDALAGAAAAGKTGSPVLLVGATSIPPATAAELSRLRPGRIVVLGASGVVSDGVVAALKAYTPGTVKRLAGLDRFATSAEISAASFDPGVEVAYVATGGNFPDALAGAAAASTSGAPVLLVDSDTIPEATVAELVRLEPGRIVVLGGIGAVSETVLTGLRAFTDGTVTRLAGDDRYATAAAISKATFAPGVELAYVATGANFPDALAGAAAAGKTGSPVLLVGATSIPPATAAELSRLRPGRIVVLGASGVVSDMVKLQLAAYAGS